MSRGLLSRLNGSEPISDTPTSIVEHLRVLLNARQGSSNTVPEYGMIDLSGVVHSLPDSMRVLRRSIEQTIAQHEPRLRDIRVRELPRVDPLVLSFEIFARLRADARSVIRFRTQVDAGGRANVEEH